MVEKKIPNYNTHFFITGWVVKSSLKESEVLKIVGKGETSMSIFISLNRVHINTRLILLVKGSSTKTSIVLKKVITISGVGLTNITMYGPSFSRESGP